jgi:hypothetical protein
MHREEKRHACVERRDARNFNLRATDMVVGRSSTSTPVIQDVDMVGDSHPGGLQVPKRSGRRSLGQVVPRVVVEPDDEDARVVTADGYDQVVKGGKVFVVPRQNRAVLGDSPGKHASIVNRPQSGVYGK